MRTLPAVLLVATAAGCAGRGAKQAAAPSPARSPVRDTLLAVDLARSDSVQRLGFVDGSVVFADEGITYLRAGLPAIYGRPAYRTVLALIRTEGVHALRWQPMGGSISRDGRSGYTYGVAAMATADGESRTDALRLDRYIAFWRREAGDWRMTAYAEIGAPALPLTVDVGLVPPGQPVSGKTADLLEELRSTDLDFSEGASRLGVETAFADWAAPEGVMFSGSEVVFGRDAIRALMRPDSTSRSLAWRPVHSGVAGSGDLGFTIGDYVATGRSETGVVTQRFGKYLTVWQKQADGRWRFLIDGGNESPGPTGVRPAGDR